MSEESNWIFEVTSPMLESISDGNKFYLSGKEGSLVLVKNIEAPFVFHGTSEDAELKCKNIEYEALSNYQNLKLKQIQFMVQHE